MRKLKLGSGETSQLIPVLLGWPAPTLSFIPSTSLSHGLPIDSLSIDSLVPR